MINFYSHLTCFDRVLLNEKTSYFEIILSPRCSIITMYTEGIYWCLPSSILMLRNIFTLNQSKHCASVYRVYYSVKLYSFEKLYKILLSSLFQHVKQQLCYPINYSPFILFYDQIVTRQRWYLKLLPCYWIFGGVKHSSYKIIAANVFPTIAQCALRKVLKVIKFRRLLLICNVSILSW